LPGSGKCEVGYNEYTGYTGYTDYIGGHFFLNLFRRSLATFIGTLMILSSVLQEIAVISFVVQLVIVFIQLGRA